MRDNIIDGRFRGMSVKVSLINGEEFDGIVDDVAKYELGITVRDSFYIVFRHGVTCVQVNAADLHGERGTELDDSLITSDFIGVDVDVMLVNGRELSGRLMKISRYELGIRVEDKGLIIPKSNIIYLRVHRV